jgi:hypothetical protein
MRWATAGQRTFEAGLDRGVLFVDGIDGVPWNGLISVAESPSGGDLQEYYFDGRKYLQLLSSVEFAATIQAYTYPDEFEVCDGTAPAGNGLFVTNQRRKSFGLCYRTYVGNDLKGVEAAYKIHLIYNALAAPTPRPNNTMSATVDPYNFSWQITTKPPTFAGFKPTAHFVINSQDTPADLLARLEDILYGTESQDPRLPSVDELIFMFESYQPTGFDAGYLTEPYFNGFDAGDSPTEPQTALIDGGGP